MIKASFRFSENKLVCKDVALSIKSQVTSRKSSIARRELSEFCCFLYVCKSTGAHIYARNKQYIDTANCAVSCKREWSCNNYFNLERVCGYNSFKIYRRTISTFSVERMGKQMNWTGRHIFAYVIRDIFLILVLLCTNPSVNLTSHIPSSLNSKFFVRLSRKRLDINQDLFIYLFNVFIYLFFIYFISQSNIS